MAPVGKLPSLLSYSLRLELVRRLSEVDWCGTFTNAIMQLLRRCIPGRRHVFCDSCLRAAVKAQKRCPTCRKTIAVRQIHRVFLNLP